MNLRTKPVPIVALSVLAPVTIFIGLRSWWPRVASMAATASATATEVSAAELTAGLLRAGLDPETLAAAGVAPSAIAALVSNVRTAIAGDPERLHSADLAYADARRTSDELRRLIQSGRGSQEDVSAYQTATQTIATATAARHAALAALSSSGTEGLAPASVQRIARIQGNRNWQVPIEFMVVDRTEAEWVALMEALANEHVAAKGEGTLDPEMQSQLATWRQHSEVALARTNRDANLAAIRTAWNGAVGQ